VIIPFTGHGWLNTAHGVLFGGGYLVLLVLALLAVAGLHSRGLTASGLALGERYVGATVAAATVAAWVAVVTGTWGIYPWFRAVPGGAASVLLARPSLAFWARWVIGSKEWVAWASVAFVTWAALAGFRWRGRLAAEPLLRRRLMGLLAVALVGAAYAGAVGTLLAKLAPVR
jgi:hypothetical protein